MLSLLKNFWFLAGAAGVVLSLGLGFARFYHRRSPLFRASVLATPSTLAAVAMWFILNAPFVAPESWWDVFRPTLQLLGCLAYWCVVRLLTGIICQWSRKRFGHKVRKQATKQVAKLPEIEIIDLDSEEGERQIGLDVNAIIANMSNYAKQRENEERAEKEAKTAEEEAQRVAAQQASEAELLDLKDKAAQRMKKEDTQRNDEAEAAAKARQVREQFQRPMTEMERQIFKDMLANILENQPETVVATVKAFFEAELGVKLQALSPEYVLSIRTNKSGTVQIGFRSATASERQKAVVELAARQAQWEKDHQKPTSESSTSSAQILPLPQPLTPAAQA